MSGKFFTFEGIDGAGKSTNLQYVADFLFKKGVPVHITREPGGTPLAESIRSLLLNPNYQEMTQRCELLLYAAARAQHVEEIILPKMKQGYVVLCDRFFDSTIAYQGYGRGIDITLILEVNKLAAQSLRPDKTFLFDIDPLIGQKRRQHREAISDRIESEKLEFHERVRNGFLQQAKSEPDRFLIIDSNQEIQTIQNQLEAFLEILF